MGVFDRWLDSRLRAENVRLKQQVKVLEMRLEIAIIENDIWAQTFDHTQRVLQLQAKAVKPMEDEAWR